MLVRQAGAGFLLVAHRVQARRHSRNTQTSSLPYTAVISLAGLAPRCAHHASVISPAAVGEKPAAHHVQACNRAATRSMGRECGESMATSSEAVTTAECLRAQAIPKPH